MVASTQKKSPERRHSGALGKGVEEWKMAATSMHDDILLDSEE